MKKINTLIVGAIVATIALAGSLTYAQSAKNIKQFKNGSGSIASGSMMGFKGGMKGQNKPQLTTAQKTAITTAIKNNDYNAFVTASGTGGRTPTTGQFADMVTKYTKQTAIKSAVDSNDYNAFVKASTPSQAEFDKMVARNKTQTAIKTAIKNNDYTAFTTALASDTNKPADAKTPTKEEFAKMVTNSANMPEDDGMMFGPMGGDHGKGGPKGGFGGQKPN